MVLTYIHTYIHTDTHTYLLTYLVRTHTHTEWMRGWKKKEIQSRKKVREQNIIKVKKVKSLS